MTNPVLTDERLREIALQRGVKWLDADLMVPVYRAVSDATITALAAGGGVDADTLHALLKLCDAYDYDGMHNGPCGKCTACNARLALSAQAARIVELTADRERLQDVMDAAVRVQAWRIRGQRNAADENRLFDAIAALADPESDAMLAERAKPEGAK